MKYVFTERTKQMETIGEGKNYELPQKCMFFKIPSVTYPKIKLKLSKNKLGVAVLLKICSKSLVLSSVYIVKWQVFSLQQAPTNSPLPPSNSRPPWHIPIFRDENPSEVGAFGPPRALARQSRLSSAPSRRGC